MMADYHQIVEQIRAALHSGEARHNGRLAALAASYADACTEAAQRLGRCHRLLQQGLRSEAIQLAESEPKLLDALAVLDFPERPEWDDLVQMSDLAAAPRIPLEPARQLNEAYAEEDPLQDLLRRHRRLALQRGSLRVRIGVLRQLAAQDPGNAIWTEDQRVFEQARMLEIHDEATEAVRQHDRDALARLVAEVEQPGWCETPDRALVHSLRKAEAQLKGERTRLALEDVAGRLDEALNSRDPIRGRLARQEWGKLALAAALPSDDPLAERTRPALEWLDEQDRRDHEHRRHEEALEDLVRALDHPGAIASSELERVARAVQSHPEGMSETLRQRYITRLRAAESAETRRRRLIAAGSAAGLVLFCSLVYLAFHAQARSNQASDSATAISDMLELGEVDHAAAVLKNLEAADPDLVKYPALVEVRERVEIAQTRESERAVKFDQAMRYAESAPPSAREPTALEEARKLARLDSEKEAVDKLVRRREAAVKAEQGRREKELSPRLDLVAASIDKLEGQIESKAGAAGRADDSAILSAISDAQRALSDLSPDVAMAGAELRDRAQSLADRLDAARAQMDRRGQQSRLEDAITAAVAYSPDGAAFSPGALAASLQAFVKAFPDSPRSREFATTLHDQPLWDAIGEWDRLTAGWRGDRAGVSPQEANIRAEQCKRFAVQYPASPEFDRATAYQKAMEAIAHRASDGEGALGKLQKLMGDLLVDNLWMITIRPPAGGGARHYYLTEQPSRDLKSVKYLAGFDGKERTLNVVADWVEKTDVAPQTKIAARFKPILARDPAQIDWESVVLDLIDQVRTQPAMDPILRVALLRKVLELGLEGSEPLQAALGGFRTMVDGADVDTNVLWMDPENREAEQARPRAAAFLRNLPDLGPARKQVLARRAAVRDILSGRPQSVGWLARDGQTWRVRCGAVVPPAGILHIVVAGKDGHGQWKKVGAIEQGKPRLAAVDDPALAEGRPVFVAPEQTSGPAASP